MNVTGPAALKAANEKRWVNAKLTRNFHVHCEIVCCRQTALSNR
jgi:hypothetical protein